MYTKNEKFTIAFLATGVVAMLYSLFNPAISIMLIASASCLLGSFIGTWDYCKTCY